VAVSGGPRRGGSRISFVSIAKGCATDARGDLIVIETRPSQPRSSASISYGTTSTLYRRRWPSRESECTGSVAAGATDRLLRGLDDEPRIEYLSLAELGYLDALLETRLVF